MTRIALSPPALAALDAIAAARGLTRRQALIRAIGVAQDCEAAAGEGLEVCAVDGGEVVRVVVGRMK